MKDTLWLQVSSDNVSKVGPSLLSSPASSVSHSLVHPFFLDSRLAQLACLTIRIDNSDVLECPRLAHREYCNFCLNLLKYFLKSTLEMVVCCERAQRLQNYLSRESLGGL